MTDEYVPRMSGTGGMRGATNPVAKIQLITYNATGAKWKHRLRNTAPKFAGPINAEHMTVLGSEPTVVENNHAIRRRRSRGIDQESSLTVFACLNGWGSAGDSKFACVKKLRFGGFKGYQTFEDPADMHTTIDFPVYQGGLFTTINGGDKTIIHGDKLYWDIPESSAEAFKISKTHNVEGRISGARGGRSAVFLRPYNAADQTVNSALIREVVQRSFNKKNGRESTYKETLAGKDGHIRKANADFVESLKAFGTLCIMAERAGLFDTNIEGASSDELFETLKRHIENGDGADLKLYKTMGLLAERGTEHGHELTKALFRVANPQKMDDKIFETGDKDRLEAKAILGIQNGNLTKGYGKLVERILANVIECEDYVKSRIVATSLTNAPPGSPIDIIALP